MPAPPMYVPGLPAWRSLYASDPVASGEFYSKVFGWDIVRDSPYFPGGVFCLSGGRAITTIKPNTATTQDCWMIFLSSANLTVDIAAAESAGGVLLAEPVRNGDSGSYAVLMGAVGETFGLFESSAGTPDPHFDLVPWHELVTNEPEKAQAFYEELFEYSFLNDSVGGVHYSVAQHQGQPAFGLWPLSASPSGARSQGRSHWMAYVATADPDAAAERAERFGGGILEDPQDSDFGRWGVIHGPAGEAIAVLSESHQPVFVDDDELVGLVS